MVRNTVIMDVENRHKLSQNQIAVMQLNFLSYLQLFNPEGSLIHGIISYHFNVVAAVGRLFANHGMCAPSYGVQSP